MVVNRMNFWFSIPEDLLKHEDFIKSKPSEKLYYFALLHYLNLHEINYETEFFKRDIDFAAALSYSEDAIRNARRKFQKLGWLDITSGFKNKRGQNVATTYHNIKWTDIPKIDEGKRFVRFSHYEFEMMLQQLYYNRISTQDMVVYCYIFCWKQLSGSPSTFYFPKKELRKYTNIIKAVQCVENIASVPVFDDKPVFDYQEDYHRIVFRLRHAADPYEDDNNRVIFSDYMKTRRDAANQLVKNKTIKEIQRAKKKGIIISSSQLPDLFNDLYEQKYAKKISTDYETKDKLIQLGEDKGVGVISLALQKYFQLEESNIPNPTRTKTLTMARFIKTFDTIIK